MGTVEELLAVGKQDSYDAPTRLECWRCCSNLSALHSETGLCTGCRLFLTDQASRDPKREVVSGAAAAWVGLGQ